MSEQAAHPTDQAAVEGRDPTTFLDPPEQAPGDEVVGRADDIDPRAPMSLEELAGIREQAEVEAELDRAGPTKIDEVRPLVVIMLPMDATAASKIMLVVADHFEGCVVEMQGDRMLVLPKPSP